MVTGKQTIGGVVDECDQNGVLIKTIEEDKQEQTLLDNKAINDDNSSVENDSIDEIEDDQAVDSQQ